MNLVLETIKQLLSEGRIEDVKKRYPNTPDDIIDYFVNNDPSGNQKYLDWMVKAYNHLPTVHSINGELLGYEPNKHGTAFTEAHIETANQILHLVTKFHNLLPYLVYEEDGKKVGTTDLYRYIFTDSEMIHYLKFDVDRAQERKEQKDELKKLSSEADKIYEDKDWLVVRPKTWEASCHYGAGTKWCTTNKQSPNHFKRETDRNFLIYVIDKNLDERNEYYKVAWQIPYLKQINSYMKFDMNGGWEVDYTKINLWDAKDINFARFGSEGIDYLDRVPKKVKSSILKYMQAKMDEMYENMAYVEDPHIQALVELLGISEDEVDGIRKETYGYYDIPIYYVDSNGSYYAVGTDDEVETSKEEWAESYINDIGVVDAMGSNAENYIYINDVDSMASEDAYNYLSDIDDEDLSDYAKGFSTKVDEMIEEYNINQGILDGLDDEISDLILRFQNEEISKEEYDSEMDEYESEKESIENHQPKLIQTIRDKYRHYIYQNNLTEMTDNVLDWLINMGWATRNGRVSQSAIDNGIVGVDYDRLVSDIITDFDLHMFSDTGNWDEIRIGGETYYIFPKDF